MYSYVCIIIVIHHRGSLLIFGSNCESHPQGSKTKMPLLALTLTYFIRTGSCSETFPSCFACSKWKTNNYRRLSQLLKTYFSESALQTSL